jgi:hypothetical protein
MSPRVSRTVSAAHNSRNDLELIDGCYPDGCALCKTSDSRGELPMQDAHICLGGSK